MKKLTLFLLALLPLFAAAQQAGQSYAIWPRDAQTESRAMFTVIPAEGDNTGIAVLIFPGGGYARLSDASFYFEGMAFAHWLSDRGVTGVVLRYTLPEGRNTQMPIADARQAMKVIRERGPKEWGVDPAKVGVMGFSAGGHLAATLLTKYDEGSRPDFGVLFYPVVTFDPKYAHEGSARFLLGADASQALRDEWSAEKNIDAKTPPTLLFHSSDDATVPVMNSILFYNALIDNKVKASMGIFPAGRHGWGFRSSMPSHEAMKTMLMDWLGSYDTPASRPQPR